MRPEIKEGKNEMHAQIINNDVLAEVIEIAQPAPAKKKMPASEIVKAEIVSLPALKKDDQPAKVPPQAFTVIRAPGYGAVLAGTLTSTMELGPEDSPILIRGNLIIAPTGALKLKAGAVVQFQSAPQTDKPAPGQETAEKAALWVWGSLTTEGFTGNPVEFAAQGKDDGLLLLYGPAKSDLEGLRLKNVAVAQKDGTCIWTNCELFNVRHYALAGGSSLFTHCTFRNCGGIFAAYEADTWSLLIRKSIFDSCREGVLLGSDPGEARLIIEKNHFLNTRGAHLRVLPSARTACNARNKSSELEFLIGENWYGNALPEEVDLRIVDKRIDPSLKARLNLRPPAELPYKNIGAGVTDMVLAATISEQQAAVQKLLAAQANRSAAARTKNIAAAGF
jgi:hypothetical protein